MNKIKANIAISVLSQISLVKQEKKHNRIPSEL